MYPPAHVYHYVSKTLVKYDTQRRYRNMHEVYKSARQTLLINFELTQIRRGTLTLPIVKDRLLPY